jgi:uncharacterized protein (TIGR00266 family)
MQYTIKHPPAFTTLEFTLDEGEALIAQPDAMLSMTTGIQISARMGGQVSEAGVRNGFKSMLSGESFFSTIFTAKRSGEKVTIAPENVGDIITLDVTRGCSFYLARGSFLACQGGVTITAKYEGLRGMMSQKSFFLLHVSGEGTVFLQSYGAVERCTLALEERLVVDNRYVLAFSDSISYLLTKASESMKDSLFSGEVLVNRYQGPGELFYQTRARQRQQGFLSSLMNITR